MRVTGASWTGRATEVADLPARLALGGAMLFHGLAKLRGEGPRRSGELFESLGMRPGRGLAVATGIAESFAGAAAILGIATRPAALAVLFTQAVAVAKVHAPKGYDNMQGGMEYNLTLMAIALGLLLAGPGPVSAHRAATRRVRARGPMGLLRRRTRPTRAEQALALLH